MCIKINIYTVGGIGTVSIGKIVSSCFVATLLIIDDNGGQSSLIKLTSNNGDG